MSRWLGLISDPEFVRMEALAAEPNFFSIVGRAHFERWHSAFLAWLLDPGGSHLTRSFPLIRLLIAAGESSMSAPSAVAELHSLAAAQIASADVTPSEASPVERSVNGVGRFDIFATGICAPLEGEGRRFNVLVEVKVDSPPDAAQATRYAEWLRETHANDLNALIYLSPSTDKSRAVDPHDAWAHLSFQELHDKVLLPTLQHPSLNPVAIPFLAQYVKNLRHTHRGQRMALTNEQRRIALALYERHHRVFNELVEVLSAEGVIAVTLPTPQVGGRKVGRMAVRIDHPVFEDTTVAGLFSSVLASLVDQGRLGSLPLPWGDTSTRFLLTNRKPAEHPSGRPFFYPVEHGGYTIETHYSRDRAIRALGALCGALEVPFEAITTTS